MALVDNASNVLSPQTIGMLIDTPSAPQQGAPEVNVGLAMRFMVEVSGLDLGHWQSCSGLSVRFEAEAMQEGGQYGYSILDPKKVTYGEITLKRAVHAIGSHKVYTWLMGYLDTWMNLSQTGQPPSPESSTATIRVLDAKNERVYAWQVLGVYPKSWTGPELRGDANSVATETLVLAYQGFNPSFSPQTM